MRFAFFLLAACASEPPELVCEGDFDINASFDQLAGCTTIAGSLRFGDTQLAAIAPLDVRVIDGTLNFFRNPNLVDLSGLGALEVVGGELLVHNHDRLETAALPRLREVGALFVGSNAAMTAIGLDRLATVNGDLTIIGNGVLPQADAEAFAAGVDVGGAVTVSDNQR